MPGDMDPKWRAGWRDHVTLQDIALEMAERAITDEAERRGFQKAKAAIATMREPPKYSP